MKALIATTMTLLASLGLVVGLVGTTSATGLAWPLPMIPFGGLW